MTAPRSIEFDVSLRPLIIVRYEGRANDSDTQAVLEQRARWLHTRERHVIIHDLTRAHALGTSAQRRVQVDWVKAHLHLMRECVLGVAFVSDSAAMRLLLSLVHHLQPLPMPQVTLPDMDAALRWSLGRLRQAGLNADAERLHHHFEPALDRRTG